MQLYLSRLSEESIRCSKLLSETLNKRIIDSKVPQWIRMVKPTISTIMVQTVLKASNLYKFMCKTNEERYET